MIRLKTTLFALCAVLCAIANTQAEGLLGQRYVEVLLHYGDLEHPMTEGDTYGPELRFNVPAFNADGDRRLGVDINTGGRFTAIEYERTYGRDIVEVDARATLYYALPKGLKPFVSVGLRHIHVSFDHHWYRDDSVDDWAYQYTFGLEYAVFSRLALITTASYERYEDLDSGAWEYSLDANYWLTDIWGIAAGVAFRDEGDAEIIEYSLGARLRF